jgi:hypothetical protein
MDDEVKDFIRYIWVRNVSKKIFEVDLDPEVSENEIAHKFNKLNLYRENFSYEEITNIIEKKYRDIIKPH